MKNLKKIIVSLVAMTFLMSVTVFAATSVKEQFVAAGVPEAYAQQLADYVSANKISTEKVDTAMANVEAIKAKVGTATKVSDLDATVLAEVKELARDAGNDLGIEAKLDSATGKVSIKASGLEVVIEEDSAIDMVKAIDVVKAKAAIEAGQELVGTEATGGEMAKTASNVGNVLVLGLGLVAVAGTLFMVSKKKVVE